MYDFLNSNFPDQEKYFVFWGNNRNFVFETNNDSCFWCASMECVVSNYKIAHIAKKCDLIVYSGLFGSEIYPIIFGLKTLKKSYIQFWGGDFYILKKNPVSLKSKIRYMYKRYIINHAAGAITLIPNDYDELCKVCHPNGKHFVAPVCGNGDTKNIINSLRFINKKESPTMILLGNSATETNQHMQVIDILRKFKDEDIQIICPLSYGDKSYGERVIQYGKQAFGSKFVPLTSYMEKDEYFKIIAECKIAVFNNNRQQAMGNIGVALALGCKVFIRTDTAMWDTYYNERKMKIFDVESISKLNYQEFLFIDENNDNYEKYLEYSDIQKSIIAWKNVFDSIR